ncbi:hypothetical protein K3495_g9274 [Podosphaera aphanis]|nr:hypothetical protein K3495_g9274 [Podosphaera aphanis]
MRNEPYQKAPWRKFLAKEVKIYSQRYMNSFIRTDGFLSREPWCGDVSMAELTARMKRLHIEKSSHQHTNENENESFKGDELDCASSTAREEASSEVSQLEKAIRGKNSGDSN